MKETLIALLEHRFSQETCKDKAHFNNSLAFRLLNAGYAIETEKKIESIADGSAGRLNYVVTAQNGKQCVIEVDNRSPRGRSMMKIGALPSGIEGFILLRDSKTSARYQISGIDVITARRG